MGEREPQPAGAAFAGLAAAVPSSPTFPSPAAPVPPADLAHLPGIEGLHANRDGITPPPLARYLLGYVLRDVRPGGVELAFQPPPAHTNYGGTLHGGILSALADSAMGCAVLSALAAGEWCATLQMTVNVHARGPRARARAASGRVGAVARWLDRARRGDRPIRR